MRFARLPWLLVLAGCTLGHPGREQLGDQAWHAARWGDAVEDYRAAGDSPRVLAKLADAELQAGLLEASAQAWTQLGHDAPGRAGEAAAGLARVAHEAIQDGKQAALVQAVLGLRQLAPVWPLGRLAVWVDHPDALPADVAVDVIPAMLAGAASRQSAEPVLLALARADRSFGTCAAAVPVLTGVMRRNPEGQLHDSAGVVLNHCALQLGLGALDSARFDDAERWLGRAMTDDSTTAVGRRALVALGDARIRQGDTVAARAAWLAVASASAADSLTQMALARLNPPAPTASGSGASPAVPPE